MKLTCECQQNSPRRERVYPPNAVFSALSHRCFWKGCGDRPKVGCWFHLHTHEIIQVVKPAAENVSLPSLEISEFGDSVRCSKNGLGKVSSGGKE